MNSMVRERGHIETVRIVRNWRVARCRIVDRRVIVHGLVQDGLFTTRACRGWSRVPRLGCLVRYLCSAIGGACTASAFRFEGCVVFGLDSVT